jgi:Flp pilus assembly protein TadD
MKTLSAIITSLAFAGPLTVASAVHAQDKASPSQPSPSTSSDKQDMTMDQLPSAVKTTVQREGKNKNIESITKSTDAKGAAAYEVKFLDGSKETTLDISASGKVTSRHTGAAKPDTSGDSQVPQPQNPPPAK